MCLEIAQNKNENQKSRYGIIKMDFENAAVIEQSIETNNQKQILNQSNNYNRYYKFGQSPFVQIIINLRNMNK